MDVQDALREHLKANALRALIRLKNGEASTREDEAGLFETVAEALAWL